MLWRVGHDVEIFFLCPGFGSGYEEGDGVWLLAFVS